MNATASKTTDDLSEQPINVASYLKTMARIQPYRRAVVYPAARDDNGRVAYSHLTFRQLDRESDCFAHGLHNAGIVRGTRTIVMVRPSLEFFALTFAMFKAGIVPVMVDPGMGVRRMLACLQESEAQALIGIPPAHALRVLCPRYFKGVDKVVTVGRRWFWGGLTLNNIRQLPWQPYPVANTTKDEIAAVRKAAEAAGARCAVSTHWADGGDGALELADAVKEACEDKNNFDFLYPMEMKLRERVEKIAKVVYGADGVSWTPDAEAKAKMLESDSKYDDYTTMMVKTHLSLTHDPAVKGVPKGWVLPIRDVLIYSGAKFLCPCAGTISLMPGTSSNPAFRKVDVDVKTGKVSGLF